MPSPKPEQHYSINLTLTREFQKWVHTHRLVDGSSEFIEQLWENKPDTEEFRFGGRRGTQFPPLLEKKSFTEDFNALLAKFEIDKSHVRKHRHFISFQI